MRNTKTTYRRRHIAAATAMLALAFSTPASAKSLKGEHFACLSEQRFNEMMQMVTNGDRRGAEHLITSGHCFVPKAGTPISVLETRWTGRTKVRAYAKGQSIDMWTFRENIQD